MYKTNVNNSTRSLIYGSIIIMKLLLSAHHCCT